jgi:hypothetical protein
MRCLAFILQNTTLAAAQCTYGISLNFSLPGGFSRTARLLHYELAEKSEFSSRDGW